MASGSLRVVPTISGTELSVVVDGLTCGGCVSSVTSILESHPDVRSARVSLVPPRAVIQLQADVPADSLILQLNKLLADEGKYSLRPLGGGATSPTEQDQAASLGLLRQYFPLVLIAAYLLGGVLLREVSLARFDLHAMMANFMGGFFVIFSFFKLLDLRGFAKGYETYDLLAARFPAYGRAYPFIELGLGVLYFVASDQLLVHALTVLVMGVSTLGVVKKLQSGERFQCACLGTIFKLPLTKVTLVEDLLMFFMALAMLIAALS